MGELPPLREGNVWAIQLYPGGRKAYAQVKPERVSSFFDALDRLRSGVVVFVWPDDAVRVWRHYQESVDTSAGGRQ